MHNIDILFKLKSYKTNQRNKENRVNMPKTNLKSNSNNKKENSIRE